MYRPGIYIPSVAVVARDIPVAEEASALDGNGNGLGNHASMLVAQDWYLQHGHVAANESAIGKFSNSHDYFDRIGHGAIPETPADVGVRPSASMRQPPPSALTNNTLAFMYRSRMLTRDS